MTSPFDILLCAPSIPQSAVAAVTEALSENAVGPYGAAMESFEAALAAYFEGRPILPTSSGTAALHLALLAIDLRPSEVVFCPTFTFAATVNAVAYCGGEPVFVDCRASDWGMDVECLRDAIHAERAAGKTLRAVVIVHAYGLPMDLAELAALCAEEELVLIEDMAGAMGSRDGDGKSVGLKGDLACGSMNANKMLTTGSGGFVLGEDAAVMERARLYCNQGKLDRLHYEHEVIGQNYRMSNFNAALGLVQLPLLSERVAIKRRQFEQYRQTAERLGIEMMPEPELGVHNHWMHACVLNRAAQQTILAMRAERIEVVPLWKPMHLQPVYKHCRAYLTGHAEKLFECGMVLPGGLDLTAAQLARVTETLTACFEPAVSQR